MLNYIYDISILFFIDVWVQVPGYDLPNTKNPDTPYLNWWKPLISKAKFESVYPYSKFIMMFSILQECENIGDKVYV
jgi:hypothetical protein